MIFGRLGRGLVEGIGGMFGRAASRVLRSAKRWRLSNLGSWLFFRRNRKKVAERTSSITPLRTLFLLTLSTVSPTLPTNQPTTRPSAQSSVPSGSKAGHSALAGKKDQTSDQGRSIIVRNGGTQFRKPATTSARSSL